MKLRFILSEVGKGLSRNRAMSVAVILVTFVSLLFVGIAGLTQMQVSKMKSEWYDKIEVTIYMCAINDAAPNCNATEASDAQIDAVRQKLASAEMTPYVANVYEETKEEAYENFQRLNGNNALTQWTTPDMLQFAFRIKLVNPEQACPRYATSVRSSSPCSACWEPPARRPWASARSWSSRRSC